MNLFDFLFPPVCPHCGAHVKQQGDWCDSCIEAVLNIRQVPSKLLSLVLLVLLNVQYVLLMQMNDIHCLKNDYKGDVILR